MPNDCNVSNVLSLLVYHYIIILYMEHLRGLVNYTQMTKPKLLPKQSTIDWENFVVKKICTGHMCMILKLMKVF